MNKLFVLMSRASFPGGEVNHIKWIIYSTQHESKPEKRSEEMHRINWSRTNMESILDWWAWGSLTKHLSLLSISYPQWTHMGSAEAQAAAPHFPSSLPPLTSPAHPSSSCESSL